MQWTLKYGNNSISKNCTELSPHFKSFKHKITIFGDSNHDYNLGHTLELVQKTFLGPKHLSINHSLVLGHLIVKFPWPGTFEKNGTFNLYSYSKCGVVSVPGFWKFKKSIWPALGICTTKFGNPQASYQRDGHRRN